MATKPVLRNLLLNQSKIEFSVALVGSVIAAAAYKFGIEVPRRKSYEDYEKNVDADAVYARMKAAGVFQYYKGDSE
uniref:Uncharacterized protein n=1 Tax=Arion vulgaris TaxID=1028688 RepID=A0A0B6YTV2_9EUPU